MTDKDFFNIWNHSSGDEVSKSEIRDSYSKVVRRIEKIEGQNGIEYIQKSCGRYSYIP